MQGSTIHLADERFETALHAWGPNASIEASLGGGVRNDVRAVRVHGVRYAGRLTSRPAVTLEWELNLLTSLAGAGFHVPLPIATPAGHRHVDGLVLFTWLDGDPPRTTNDWTRVRTELDRLHGLTRRWPQRPGFHSTRDLLSPSHDDSVWPRDIPAEVVARCRAAWRRIADEPHSVVHGDPGEQNIRFHRTAVGFLDWDEARVDASVLDLAALPIPRATLGASVDLEAIKRAASAWEAVNGWTAEPAYARRRLTEL